jgi:hypothetical protein
MRARPMWVSPLESMVNTATIRKTAIDSEGVRDRHPSPSGLSVDAVDGRVSGTKVHLLAALAV